MNSRLRSEESSSQDRWVDGRNSRLLRRSGMWEGICIMYTSRIPSSSVGETTVDMFKQFHNVIMLEYFLF